MEARRSVGGAAGAPRAAFVIGKTVDIRQFYKLGKQIGQPGQFGVAVVATHIESNQVRAVKCINKLRFSRAQDKDFHFKQLRGEIEVMKTMKHKNIIQFIDVFEDESTLYIVMELCTGGELFDRIKEQGTISEADASAVLRQMCEGIQYMHSRHIAHCDLKPDNFLFVNRTPQSPIKIIDFGMAKFCARREYLKTMCGTPYYVAPDVLNGHFNEAADMWSFGVVMFVTLFGFPPFYADQNQYGAATDDKIYDLIRQGFDPRVRNGYGPFFPAAIPVSDSVRDLIGRLLTRDMAKRLTAAEALQHPWLTGETASNRPLDQAMIANLRQFDASNKFKQAVLQMMSNSLPESEVAKLKRTFAAIDENGDGVITVDELRKALSRSGDLTDVKEVEQIMKGADLNGDGKLSYQELLLTAVNRNLAAKEERLWTTFRQLDVDGNGKLTADEVRKVLNAKNAEELIAAADTDGNGSIDYDEFCKLWAEHELVEAKSIL